MRAQITDYNEVNLCLATGESEIDTIPELIPLLLYIQNLLSSHAFKTLPVSIIFLKLMYFALNYL